MKIKQISIIFFAIIAVCSIAIGQNKETYNLELLDMGDGKIISSTYNESGNFVIQEFKIEVEITGKYYLAAWVKGGLYSNGEKLEYSVLVNDERNEFKTRAKKSHAHAIDFGEKTIYLNSGENKITFKTSKPYCPNVEFIKVSLDIHNHQISSEKFDKYMDEISKQKLPDNYAATKSVSTLMYTLPNPSGNYDHEMDVDFGYSYYTMVFLDDDEICTFETKNATNDPVIHLLGVYGGIDLDHSWTDDNSGTGNNAKLTVDIGLGGWILLSVYKKSRDNRWHL